MRLHRKKLEKILDQLQEIMSDLDNQTSEASGEKEIEKLDAVSSAVERAHDALEEVVRP